MPGRWSSPVVVVVSLALSSCIFTPILQESAAVPLVSVGIIVCNAHANVFFLQVLLHFGRWRGIPCRRSHSSAVLAGGGCRLPDGQRVELAHLPPLVVVGGQLFAPEHWSPGDSSSLPSPLLFFSRRCSVMMGRASRWWWLFCPAVLLSVLPRWALLGVVVWGSIL